VINDFDHKAATRAASMLLSAIGEDVEREGLASTPKRYAKAWAQMTAGYRLDPAEVLKTSDGADGFDEVGGYDQLVAVGAIPFWSTCEHHLLPFGGVADVGYLPGKSGRVVGLSKIPRLVDMFARRLQVQERMTQQIADTLTEHLNPSAVGVRIIAEHLCVACRGVNKRVKMATCVFDGRFRESSSARAEWLDHMARCR